jgi:integrase
MFFTDKYLTSLKPKDKQYYVREGQGFAVRVLPSGVKTFLFIYTLNGKRRQKNLGNYPAKKLADARQEFRDSASTLVSGVDPQASPPLPPDPPPEEKTVADVSSEFLKNWSKLNYSARWHYNVERAMEKDVLPLIGVRAITTIRRREIISLLETVVARAPGQARNVYKAVAKMFWYAQDREYIDTTPCTNMLNSIPALRVAEGKSRVLDDMEIKKFWRRIDRGPGNDSVKRALKMILVTCQRPEEVVGMHRNEINGHWWTIPWQRIKTENSKTLSRPPHDHRVYLTPLALELIGDEKKFIFPTLDSDIPIKSKALFQNVEPIAENVVKNPSTPIRRNSLSQRVERGITLERRDTRKIQFKYYGLSPWTPHDLRRSARTGMSRIEIPSNWAEEVMNHKKDKIRSIYDHHKYDEQKRKALTRWAEHLEGLLNIVKPITFTD